jgi:hypothetical protein
MARAKPIYDVFISYSANDRRVAEDIAAQLRNAEITAFLDVHDIPVDANIGDTIWEAISESRVLIAIFSQSDGPWQGLGFEIGAAAAWNKPVFIVLNARSTTRLPRMLRSFPVFALGRIGDLVQQIKSLQSPLTDATIKHLIAAYISVGVPTDQLSSSPNALQKLTKLVNQHSEGAQSSETLLRELLRLRKRGQLPRLRKAK